MKHEMDVDTVGIRRNTFGFNWSALLNSSTRGIRSNRELD